LIGGTRKRIFNRSLIKEPMEGCSAVPSPLERGNVIKLRGRGLKYGATYAPSPLEGRGPGGGGMVRTRLRARERDAGKNERERNTISRQRTKMSGEI
jgi:hypothetical protein